MKIIKTRKRIGGIGYYARIDFFGRDKKRPTRSYTLGGLKKEHVDAALAAKLLELKK